jgi:hypothetical protein
MYEYKTEPFAHQHDIVEKTWDREEYALWWEQGTGKSKPMIDTAARLYEADLIDGVVVIAPNNVQRNWHTDEIPAHLPDRVRRKTHSMVFFTHKRDSKPQQREVEHLIKHHRGLSWLNVSYDCVMTEHGKKTLWNMLRKRRVLYIADESSKIKSPGAAVTKRTVASGKYGKYRRVLCGTPVPNGPFDMYSQIKFLSPDFWTAWELDSFHLFKHYFGIWKTYERKDNGREFTTCVEYKNLGALYDITKYICDRKLKDEVLDLPPKMYKRRYYQLTPAQKKMYKDLASNFFIELPDGTEIFGELAIVRYLRFHQIGCGYIPVPEGEEPHYMIPGKNPRLDLLVDIVTNTHHQMMIWTRFTKDIDLIIEELDQKGVS